MWLAPVTVENIAGGVVFVTLVNFGQGTDTRNRQD
jgi:formate/nitrite transporter FocA (FNT family)